jgi:hypothetical protein
MLSADPLLHLAMDDIPSTYERAPEREEDRQFSPQAVTWLLSFSDKYLPAELAKAYPRIVNRLAETWSQPAEGRKYLESLLVDERGGREGFPLPIVRELMALKELRNRLHPPKTDIWDAAHLIHLNVKK